MCKRIEPEDSSELDQFRQIFLLLFYWFWDLDLVFRKAGFSKNSVLSLKILVDNESLHQSNIRRQYPVSVRPRPRRYRRLRLSLHSKQQRGLGESQDRFALQYRLRL